MGKSRKPRPSDILGRFVMVPLAVLESPAWRLRPTAAAKALDRLLVEHARKRGTGNGALCVTFDQFAEYGVRRQSIGLAVRQLKHLGLVEVIREGFRTSGGRNVPSLYRLTFVHNADYEQMGNPTDEWERLKTDDDALAALAAAEVEWTAGSRKAQRGTPAKNHPKKRNAGCENAPSTGCGIAPEKPNAAGCETAPSGLGADVHPPSRVWGRGPPSDTAPGAALEPAA